MKTKMITRREKGAAAVEFAIVLPLMCLLLFGIIEFSVLLYDKAMITNASREGARAGIVFKDPRLTQEELEDLVDPVVFKYAENHLINFGGSSVLPPPTVVSVDENANGIIDSGDSLTVTVRYTYNYFMLPYFISFFGSWADEGALVAVTRMLYE